MTDNFHQISIGDRIKDIFLDINRQHIRPTEIHELNAGIDFNRQTDTWNCGIFICLFSEEFLFADKFMIENLDINKERARILRNLRKLMVNDNIDFEYREQRTNFDELTNLNGKQLRKSFIPLPTKENTPSTESILMDLKRINESSVDKENRLEDQRKRQKIILNNETQTEKENRLEDQQKRQKIIRDTETPKDKENRLTDDRKRKEKARQTKKLKLPPLYRAAENWINVDKFEFVSTILNIKCKHCVAKHWWEELTQENQRKQNFSFEKCCHHGKVRLDKLPDYPEILRQLMEGKHIDSKAFFDGIRRINSAVSFASVNPIRDTLPKNRQHGPYCFRIHGMITHKINTALFPSGNDPSWGQLYLIDQSEATDIRLKNNPTIERHLLEVIGNIIRKESPYAEAYNMMFDEYKKQEQIAVATNSNMPNIAFKFSGKKREHDVRYNISNKS